MTGTAGMQMRTLGVWTRMQLDYGANEQAMACTDVDEFWSVRTDKRQWAYESI